MPHHKWQILVAFSFTAISSALASAAEIPSAAVDIRDDVGNVLVPADKITSYDWPTHTFTLVLGERAKLAKSHPRGSFAVCIGNKPMYTGKFTTSESSISVSTPVILLDPASLDPKAPENQIQIQLGYPTREFFRGEDPRGNQRLRAALRATGKLAKVPPMYTQWIADSLLEMQTIKPGMTRAALLQVFAEEGGLSTRTERRYAYRDCPYIKVNVKFESSEAPEDKHANHPTDKIREISQPFLEWSIGD